MLHGDKRCSAAKQLRERRTSSNIELGPFDLKMENNKNKHQKLMGLMFYSLKETKSVRRILRCNSEPIELCYVY